MQIIKQYSDRYGNTVGLTSDGREWLLAVYDTTNNRLVTQRPPKPYVPIKTNNMSMMNTQNDILCGTNDPFAVSNNETPRLDELGRPITNSGKNTTETKTVVQEVRNDKYITVQMSNDFGIEPRTVTLTQVDVWDTGISKNTIGSIKKVDEFKLTTRLTPTVMSWLKKVSICAKAGVKPTTIDEVLDKRLTEALNKLLPTLSFTSLLDDYDELRIFINDDSCQKDKEAFTTYMEEFLKLNEKKSYEVGEIIQIVSLSLVYNPESLSIEDELANIDTLKTLDVPEDASLRHMLNRLNVNEVYVLHNDKTFHYKNNKIRIYHIT